MVYQREFFIFLKICFYYIISIAKITFSYPHNPFSFDKRPAT